MIHIGLDFDDTLMDTRKSIVSVLNKQLKRNIMFDEVMIYEISELYGQSFEDFQEFFTINQDELHHMEPYPFLQETLSRFVDKIKFTIMTGRPIEWMESAKKWIKENDIMVESSLCASQFENGKLECAKLNGVSLFIEDHPAHALSLADGGINVLLIDKPYNQECQHERITRVRDWKEIGDILDAFVP
ncbi:HAD hydrolase-like protein [Paenibacillus filicis]|uniref:Nucleotidase n=1 Tax=Paenibacillus gyeongsangnamensis TaxID=3388067 RepID=A0ABT4QJB7_9BACL|nr:HAD hydrolase-like protein [Paenibacillus filicis]MCZ8516790.1 HAD hydrolase-like protein [Paenibacillus filicis]